MTNDDLSVLAEKWQKILWLRDWDIRCSLVRAYDLDSGKGAQISFSRPHRTATIRILDPIDYDPASTNFPEDVESSLVHELLHLHFAIFDEEFGSQMVKLEEVAINAIEKALITLDRKTS